MALLWVYTADTADLQGTVGPMARSVADLTYQTKIMLEGVMDTPDAHEGEPLLPVRWKAAVLPKRMRFGWYTDTAGVKARICMSELTR